MQKEYRVRTGQTIYDLALMLYGDISQVYKIIQDNNISHIGAGLEGLTINYDEQTNAVAKQVDLQKLVFNTGEVNAEGAAGVFDLSFDNSFS